MINLFIPMSFSRKQRTRSFLMVYYILHILWGGPRNQLLVGIMHRKGSVRIRIDNWDIFKISKLSCHIMRVTSHCLSLVGNWNIHINTELSSTYISLQKALYNNVEHVFICYRPENFTGRYCFWLRLFFFLLFFYVCAHSIFTGLTALNLI